jgi:uncharacterized repeat protein (TIGR03803 family)
MKGQHWLRRLLGRTQATIRRPAARRPRNVRLLAERLEGRCVPTFTTLALFDGANGGHPDARLFEDSSGNLFGTTHGAGAYPNGTVFEIQQGSGVISSMATFNGLNGDSPDVGLVEDSSGNLFGATVAGGPAYSPPFYGYGTVFEVQQGSGTVTTLANFNEANGYRPDLGNIVEDASGNIFGTTAWGGPYGGTLGDGTAFEVQQGSGTLINLAFFDGTNGDAPYGGMIEDSSGNLFGTTEFGGASDKGTVFEIRKGSGTITTLAAFDGNNGLHPLGSLVEDSSANLFGTTQDGGANGDGTVFEVARGSGTITTLASFGGGNGANPEAGLVEDSSGNLFGTTANGGTFSGGPALGTVFEVPSGTGTIVDLVTFNNLNGANPVGGLIEDRSGNLFGTTDSGGYSYGTVFELSGATSVPALTISASFPDTTAGASYRQTITASGGTGMLTFSTTGGTLPPGLLLSTSGVLSGTCTAAGTYAFTVTVSDMSGDTANKDFALTINSAVTITTTTLPNGTVNQSAYNATISATDGTGTFTFALTAGTLPVGLTLSSAGVLSGSPTTPGNYSFTVTATDSVGVSGSQTCTVTINTPALVGWWRGEGNAFDSSGNNNSGTIAGGVTYAAGEVGEAFQLDGIDGGIDAGNAPSLQVSSGDFTVGAWVNFDALTHPPGGNLNGAPQGDMSIVDRMAATGTVPNTDGWRLIKQDDNHFWFGFGGGAGINGLTGSSPTTVMSQTTVTTGQWYYVVGVKNASGFALYVNGVLEASSPLAPFTDTNSAHLLLGSSFQEGAHLNGFLDEAMLFNFALSNSQIEGIYNEGLAGQSLLQIKTPSLAGWTVNQSGYSQTVTTTGGTGPPTFSLTGSPPPGLTLSSGGILSGTPMAAGSFSFTVTATDAAGVSASQAYTLTINPGSLFKYLVTIRSSTFRAGDELLVSVQAADSFGNPVTSYSGPSSVTVSISPTSVGSSVPASVAINNNGLGYFLAMMQQAGTYTISVSSGSSAGSSSPVIITAGPAAKLRFAGTPAATPTGDLLPVVGVQVEDLYGNVVTTDNTDSVTVGIGNGPGSFTSGSTLTATVHNGVATFNNLTLVTPGTYQLSAVVPGLYTGPNSNHFSVTPLQVLAGSFVGSPSGFTLQFNAPYLLSTTTPVLYGQGSGSAAPAPSVIVTTDPGNLSDRAAYVAGSLAFNPAGNALTFLATNTTLQVNTGSPLLADGVYTVIVRSSAATNGLQAANPGGGFLDGLGSGAAGSGDFTASFTVNAAAVHDDVLWIPDTADGPGQALSAPGMNQKGGGYPLYLNDSTGMVTSVQVTLAYDPMLLQVTGVTGAGFTLLSSSTPGHAVLQYSGPSLPSGTQKPIGFITATVPSGTTASPVPYHAKDLLHLSSVSLNGGTIPVATSDGLHLVAYVGDTNGDGTYSSDDALRITRVLLQADTGFAAYPSVDPVIVADTDGAGFIPADAALQVNEAGVGVPAANLPTPPLPSGVVFQRIVPAIRHAVMAITLSPDVNPTNNQKHMNIETGGGVQTTRASSTPTSALGEGGVTFASVIAACGIAPPVGSVPPWSRMPVLSGLWNAWPTLADHVFQCLSRRVNQGGEPPFSAMAVDKSEWNLAWPWLESLLKDLRSE